MILFKATVGILLASLASAALAQPVPPTPPRAPEPTVADVPDAAAALHNALDKLCPWFLAGQGYSIEAARQEAAEAGFHHGSPARYFPAGPSPTGASVALGFTFVTKDIQTSGRAVVAFLAFDPTACQVQVFGDKDAVQQYKVGLAQDGWRVTNPSEMMGKFSLTKYKGRAAGLSHDVQLVIAEPSDPTTHPGAVQAVINMLPLP